MNVRQREAHLQAIAIRELRVQMYSAKQGQLSADSIKKMREKIMEAAFVNVEEKTTMINAAMIPISISDKIIREKILPAFGVDPKVPLKPTDTQSAMEMFKNTFKYYQSSTGFAGPAIRVGAAAIWNVLVNAVQWIFTAGLDILTDNTIPFLKRVGKFFGALLGSTVAV